MKKIFAIILVVLMLLPCIIACDRDTNTDSGGTDTVSGTDTGGTGTGTGSTGTGTGGTGTGTGGTGTGTGGTGASSGNGFSSKDTVLDNWSGKTLNILATRWNTDTPSGPWSVLELCVSGRDDNSNFGVRINNAVVERAEYIQSTYGVTLNWIQAPNSISNLLSTSIADGDSGEKYHIAMPRMYEAQNIVLADLLYDMGSSEYLDFSQSYFNQMAYESYTAGGHTFYAAGDFNFLDEMTSYMIFYNKTFADTFANFPDLYEMVRAGTWTIDQLFSLARAAGSDNGDGEWTNDDTYGFATTTLSQYYQVFGVQQVRVNSESGLYEITLDDPKVGTVINKILEAVNGTWARTEWPGNWDEPINAFKENRVLFLDAVVQQFDNLSDADNIEIGALPLPKLSETQETYLTPCAYQSVVICIPRTTDDRDFSEYFVDVLSWTGQEYIMPAYHQNLRNRLADRESLEMIQEYIFANLVYDQGYLYGWEGLLKSVQDLSYSTGTNKFSEEYDKARLVAMTRISEWNEAWELYED